MKKNNTQYPIPDLKTNTFPENIEITQGEPFDPVIESISLEMRQQELDGRYCTFLSLVEKNPRN